MQSSNHNAHCTYPVAIITEKGEKLLRGGHVWVYADEVISLEKNTGKRWDRRRPLHQK